MSIETPSRASIVGSDDRGAVPHRSGSNYVEKKASMCEGKAKSPAARREWISTDKCRRVFIATTGRVIAQRIFRRERMRIDPGCARA